MGLMRPMTTVFIVQRQFLLSESTLFHFTLGLFHRHRLRQVTRLVHIGALEHGHVVGQQL